MKMSIGMKIGGAFAVPLIFLVVIGVVSYTTARGFVYSSGRVDHSYKVMRELDSIVQAMTDAETGQRGYLITGENSYLQPYDTGTASVNGYMKDLRTLTSDDAEQQQLLASMEPLISSKFAELKQTIDLRRSGGLQAALPVVLAGKGKAVMDQIRGVVSKMETVEAALLAQREAASRRSSETLIYVIIFGVLGAVVVTFLLTVAITRDIAPPLRKLTEVSERLAEGDIGLTDLPRNRHDEVGALSRSFADMAAFLNGMAQSAARIAEGDLTVRVEPVSTKDVLGTAFARMIGNLRSMTGQLQEAVETLASSASEILASTTQVAAGAAETATGVNETTTTVEEVKQTAQVSNQKARDVSDGAQRSLQHSRAGTKAVEDTIDGMNSMREQMETVADSIVRLSEQSQAIGEIIATVNELTEQSKLLAVNASIEAAKAGEMGKGFAVVAQEVKNLATQSKQATAQIRGILGDVQKATSSAVMSTEQASKVVEAGVAQSTEVVEAIRLLAESIADAAQSATQITASSQEQVVGMDQIVAAMESIKVASNQNVASTRQAEAAAQQLHDLGQKLKELVDQYSV